MRWGGSALAVGAVVAAFVRGVEAISWAAPPVSRSPPQLMPLINFGDFFASGARSHRPARATVQQDPLTDVLDEETAMDLERLQSRLCVLEGVMRGEPTEARKVSADGQKAILGRTERAVNNLDWVSAKGKAFRMDEAEQRALSYAATGCMLGVLAAKVLALTSGMGAIVGTAAMILLTRRDKPSSPAGRYLRAAGSVPLIVWRYVSLQAGAATSEFLQRYRVWRAFEKYFKPLENLEKEWEVVKQVENFGKWCRQLGTSAESKAGEVARFFQDADRGMKQTLKAMPKNFSNLADSVAEGLQIFDRENNQGDEDEARIRKHQKEAREGKHGQTA